MSEQLMTAEQLVARTMYLLSRAATAGICPERVRAVIQHLELVAGDDTLDPTIRATSEKLALEWRAAQTEQLGEGNASKPVSH